MNKTGVLLINLGTPDKACPKAVYKYLKEFLNDPRVIDLPTLFRYILTNFIIVPFRYKKSTEAYQQIWQTDGSPLLSNCLKLKHALNLELGNAYQVEMAMRYGNPSIDVAYQNLKACEKIMVVPLFPQYSSAATGSAIEKFLLTASKEWNIPNINIKRDFYNHPAYIQAYANIIKVTLTNKDIDLLLFSYHGLPERHIHKSECQAKCNKIQACPTVAQNNSYCYRAQCYETTKLITNELGLADTKYSVSYQSRLGRTPWIKPYTDLELSKFIQQGIRNIAMVCPSFVADCLETLEEINIRAREQWKILGGNEFTFIPCLNDSTSWVKGLANIIRD